MSIITRKTKKQFYKYSKILTTSKKVGIIKVIKAKNGGKQTW